MKIINHGVISPEKRPQDYLAGEFTFISYEVRNPNGDWRPYLVEREKQYGKQDSMSCVSFSACSSIEMQEKLITGKENNYSDRFIAKMSGTTPEGNYLYKVGDAIRKFGLIREADYPAPANYTFSEYHANIPETLLSKFSAQGKEWLEQWDVKTEFVTPDRDSIRKHLKHAPLQIVIPGHAIVCVVAADNNKVTYFDTYPHAGDFLYTAPYSSIQAAYKYVLTPKTMIKRFIINDNGKLGVLTLERFTGNVQFCDKFEEWPAFKKMLKVDDKTPTLTLPVDK